MAVKNAADKVTEQGNEPPMIRRRGEVDDSESGVGSSAGALNENALVLPLPTKPEEAKVTYTGVPAAMPAPQPKSKPEGLSMEQRLPLSKKLAEAIAAVSAASSSTSPAPKPPPRELLERTAKETTAIKATDQGNGQKGAPPPPSSASALQPRNVSCKAGGTGGACPADMVPPWRPGDGASLGEVRGTPPHSVSIVTFGLEALDDELAVEVASLGGGAWVTLGEDTLRAALWRSWSFRADLVVNAREFPDPAAQRAVYGHTGTTRASCDGPCTIATSRGGSHK